jgi:hypothetical protein
MADIFVSYKSADRPHVQRLVSGLRAHDLTVWWDQDLPPDAPWEATIERELKGAKATVVVWSELSVVSENVKSEARWARRQGRLIQVFVAHCDPPLFFGERQGVSLNGWSGDIADHRFQILVGAARAVVSGGRPPEGVEFAPAKRRRLWRIAAGGAGTVAAAVVLVVGAARLVVPTPHPTTPASNPRGAEAQARQQLIQSVTGSWDRQQGACAEPILIAAATDSGGATAITVSGPNGFKSAGQVITAQGHDVITRDIDPARGDSGETWDYQPNGALMTVIDSKGVHTPLVRCPAK